MGLKNRFLALEQDDLIQVNLKLLIEYCIK